MTLQQNATPQSTLERLLDRLDDIQTQRLLQELVAEQPELIETIDRLTEKIAPSTLPVEVSQLSQKVTIDTSPYRNQVHQILREAVYTIESGWNEEDPTFDDLADLIYGAQELAKRGEKYNAIAALSNITETCAENWDAVDEYGIDNDEIVSLLNEIWTEVIPLAELSTTEKAELYKKLKHWEYEWNADFSPSLEILNQN